MKIINYEWCSENSETDKEFLGWIFARLQNVYRENYNRSPHLRRLANIIDNMEGEIPSGPNSNEENEKNREMFRQALADAGFAGFTTFSSPILEAYDRIHCPNLRK